MRFGKRNRGDGPAQILECGGLPPLCKMADSASNDTHRVMKSATRQRRVPEPSHSKVVKYGSLRNKTAIDRNSGTRHLSRRPEGAKQRNAVWLYDGNMTFAYSMYYWN